MIFDIEVLDWYKKTHRFTNYLGAAMLYLKDNYFLEEELKPEHIKPRLLGHWGTVPGLNFIYLGLNYIISKYKKEILFLAGPGHGAPAVIANLFLEKTLSEYFAEITFDADGVKHLLKNFSWPEGFPSHVYPGLPGSIHEGGELGYSLGVAYGAVLDNPNLCVACVVGDGEAETASLAASWHSNKFINPQKDGTVLPILHLNGYKISCPTIYGTMSYDELNSYFTGLGYDPIFVDQYTSEDVYADFLNALENAFQKIDEIKSYEVSDAHPIWPMIIFKSKKGWTCPATLHGKPLEDSNFSHNIPIKNPQNDPEELESLQSWLQSYKINELLDDVTKSPSDELQKFVPQGELRMGKNKHANENSRSELILPDIGNYVIAAHNHDMSKVDKMEQVSIYLRDVFRLNRENRNFRLYSPDESESNMLEPIFEETGRVYEWPIRKDIDTYMYKEGRIMELLSENVLQEWMQGYNLTGRYGIYISYEAFLNIISSQIDQYIKYLKQWMKITWRPSLPSMNYLATSTLWRQEHNGFTHQNPSLISTLMVKQSGFVSIYFPADANTLLYTMQDSFQRKNCVNFIVAGKRNMPVWLSSEDAKEHVRKGLSLWSWACTKNADKDNNEVDVVLASAGDYQTEETLAAISILKDIAPDIGIRYVNINEITKFGFGDEKRPIMTESDIDKFFTKNKDVIFNFHGYPETIRQLTSGHEISFRMKVLGYIEEGTTTTPFDMQVRNGTSRYHVAMKAIESASKFNKSIEAIKKQAIDYLEKKLLDHKLYIVENNEDMPEVRHWKWE